MSKNPHMVFETALERIRRATTSDRVIVLHSNPQRLHFWSSTLVALLAVCFLVSPVTTAHGQEQGYFEEVWTGIAGDTVESLTTSDNYPDEPDSTRSVTGQPLQLQTSGDNLGVKYSGYLIPPMDGEYTFAITSDDAAEFWMSNDESPANIALIASAPAWTGVGEFTKYPSQISSPKSMKSGRGYYFEILYSNASGGQHMRAAWKGPNDEGAFVVGEPAIAAQYLFLTPPPHPQPIRIDEGVFVGPSFRVTGRVDEDGEFTLWKSVGLNDWFPLAAGQSSSGIVQIVDPEAAGPPGSFYRISSGNLVPVPSTE